jgi:hypothetical protein
MRTAPVVFALFLLAVVAVSKVVAAPDEPANGKAQKTSQPDKGPLAGLPSRTGTHLAKIEALGDNAWLNLGSPAADPKWGQARGRSWTATMPLAPELRGAFLAGQGVHGYVKPDGHYQDDLWFYDINAHRWICCYPGAHAKTLDLKINEDGFEATAEGQPVPVAWLGHGYEMSAYDSDLKRFMSMPCGDPYWEAAIPQRKRWLKSAPADASPWFFESLTGRWNRKRTMTRGPATGFGDALVYVPTKKQAFFVHRSSEVWFYDPCEETWTAVKAKGQKPPFGIDPTCCYDSKRDRIYIGGGGYPSAPDGANAFWIYDLKTDAWLDPKPTGEPNRGSTRYSTNNALMAYDGVNDVVLLIVHSFHADKPDRLGVYVYDPKDNSWAKEPLPIPEKLGRNGHVKNGFYDPVLNAVFIHSAGDSRDKGDMWVFRYKAAKK